jgi:hypothetical protein
MDKKNLMSMSIKIRTYLLLHLHYLKIQSTIQNNKIKYINIEKCIPH